MQYEAFAITDAGTVRTHNEDCVVLGRDFITDGELARRLDEPFLAAVCDGVGGIRSGEVAARLCAGMLAERAFSDPDELSDRIAAIHRAIRAYGQVHEECRDMQTTLCCLAADAAGRAYCFNCGDSRLFLHRGGKTAQVSVDHTLAQHLFDAGQIDARGLAHHPDSHVITAALGIAAENPSVDIIPIGGRLGECADEALILCSDGISDFVGADEIEICLSLDADFKAKIEALFDLALEKGTADNLSIIGIRPVYPDAAEFQ
ncbi:MAG: serine/threonine-protein phosphatase [Oscillospiraceae bacterium]